MVGLIKHSDNWCQQNRSSFKIKTAWKWKNSKRNILTYLIYLKQSNLRRNNLRWNQTILYLPKHKTWTRPRTHFRISRWKHWIPFLRSLVRNCLGSAHEKLENFGEEGNGDWSSDRSEGRFYYRGCSRLNSEQFKEKEINEKSGKVDEWGVE